MFKSSLIFAAVILAATTFAVSRAQDLPPQPQPIPNSYDGHVKGAANAQVYLEIFIDFMCPASAAAWPTMKQLLTAYAKQPFALIVHVFPLPYHRTAYLAAQASLVLEQKSPALFWSWADMIFQKQTNYWNAPTANQTQTQIIQSLAQLVSNAGWMQTSEFIQGMNDDNLDWNTRVSWKWAAGRGVYGTPMFMVNGVIAPNAGSDWTVTQWRQFLDPLFAKTKSSSSPVRVNMS